MNELRKMTRRSMRCFDEFGEQLHWRVVTVDRLLERFAIDPKRAVYIDDVAANVDAARPFGIHTVHFTTPSALRAELAELGLLPARLR